MFTLTETGGSESLGIFQRLVFWGLQIGGGLATATLMAEVLNRRKTPSPPWRFILYSGLAGAVLFAPFAYAVDHLFSMTALEAPDSVLDRLATLGPLAAILAEGLQILPEYLVCWFLVNLESFYPLSKPSSQPTTRTESVKNRITEPSSQSCRLLRRLPPAIGQELIAATSDLHYLHVITARGTAMVLGTLTELEHDWGDKGVRIHRSHWVAKKHVKRMIRKGNRWWVEMDSNHTFPISRRKREDVESIFGRDFTVHTAVNADETNALNDG